MSDPRERLWNRIQKRHVRTGVQSEAPESGILTPEGEPELFALERPLPPEHPGHLQPHYRMEQVHPGHAEGFPPPPVHVPAAPKGNKFYDNFRTQQIVANDTIEYLASGSLTAPAANNSTAVSITNIAPLPRLRLLELPWTLQAHIIVRRFCATPLTSADTGGIIWSYVDRGGIEAILNAGPAATAVNQDVSFLMPTPFTDATPGDFGSIKISAGAGAVTAATWLWYMNFSFLYLKPGDLDA